MDFIFKKVIKIFEDSKRPVDEFIRLSLKELAAISGSDAGYLFRPGDGINASLMGREIFQYHKPEMFNDPMLLDFHAGQGSSPVRCMIAPVIMSDKVSAVIVVAGKAEEYSAPDLQTLTILSSSIVALADQKRAMEDYIAGKSKQPDTGDAKGGEEDIRIQENLLSRIFDILPVGLWLADKTGKLIRSNAAGRRIWGGEPLVGQAEYRVFKARRLPSREEIAPDDWALSHTIKEGRTITDELLEIDGFDGKKRIILNYTTPVWDEDGNIEAAIIVNNDITEHKLVEVERERLASAIEQAAEIILITSVEGKIVYVNPSFERVTGYSREEVLGKNPRLLKSGQHDNQYYKKLWNTITSGKIWHGQLVNRKKDGSLYNEDVVISPVRDATGQIANFVAVKHDISYKIQMQAEQEALQEQLYQAQKIESIGRLAGGVAHDFNNMLQTILGNIELTLDSISPEYEAYDYLLEIQSTARRSALLTRQLLAFARRQTVNPKVLNLNDTISGLLMMLRRLIGENISLSWKPGLKAGSIMMDPSQIDQILANLCVNARDAISGSGVILIETGEAVFDTEFCALNPGYQPGEFVVMGISDTGSGMTDEVMEHIFEPFFTTKSVGEGTGLGLATVYGIIKQNKGFINVESEPDQGTAFKIYIPKYKEVTGDHPLRPKLTPMRSGTETILLVEDDPTILNMGKTILLRLDYEVLTAGTPNDAIRIVQEYTGDIHVLITDIVMPEMNGRMLADCLKTLRPDLKCIYMSGYTADVVAHDGILDTGIVFLQKPFTRGELAQKIREVLDGD